MNARFAKRLSFQPLQLQANEHGLIQLNVRRRPLRLPVEIPPNATRMQVIKARLERFLDFLLGA